MTRGPGGKARRRARKRRHTNLFTVKYASPRGRQRTIKKLNAIRDLVYQQYIAQKAAVAPKPQIMMPEEVDEPVIEEKKEDESPEGQIIHDA